MDVAQDQWLSSVIFEHACKQNLSRTIKYSLDDNDLVTKIIQNSVDSSTSQHDKPKIKPVFMLIFLLKKLYSIENLTSLPLDSNSTVLSSVIELLTSTFKQCNFMSLKKFFTFMSELKLLDILQLIVNEAESSLVIQKLNQHFPRWSPTYGTSMMKDFSIENVKMLNQVEESHGQCRRLILKIAVDKSYKEKYLSKGYSSDMERLSRETKEFMLEVVASLQTHTGSSVLEKMLDEESSKPSYSQDLGVQLLLDYVQPEVTDDALVKFLNDLEPVLNSQPIGCLSSCLHAIDIMSDDDDESGSNGSDYESVEDITDSLSEKSRCAT